MKSGINLWL